MKQKDNELQLLPKKTFWARLREEKYLQIMALLGIVWMLIFNYIPMYGILIAFKKNFFITTPLFSKKFFTTPWATNHGFQHFVSDPRGGAVVEVDLSGSHRTAITIHGYYC